MENVEFQFIDELGRAIEPDTIEAIKMVADFSCLGCGYRLKFEKPYEYVPLHCESILRRCDDAQCPKCGTVHRHTTWHGEDAVEIRTQPASTDPKQLSLFTT